MIKIDKLIAAYTLLEEFLAATKWELADHHTYDIQLLLVERSEFGSWSDLYPDFPCQDLRTIDELWVKYSQGRFGYSIQKQIYKQFTGRTKYTKFCEAIGLRSQGRWICPPTYTLDAPLGHLPYFSTGLSRGKQDVRWWFEHLEECGL